MSYQIPDFESPKRGKGNPLSPDFGSGGPKSTERGKYPADSGGPPQTKVGDKGPSGDPQGLTGMDTFNETFQTPAQSPRFVASRDK